MTSFGPDFGKLYPADKTTPNPGIHNQDGATGTTNPGSLPATSDQTKQVAKTISGGVVRDVAVALGNVVATVGDVFDDAFNALSDWGTGIIDRFKALFNGWIGGSGGTGSVAEVIYVMEDIKDTIINGFTVSTFTIDTVAWPVPSHVEMTAILIGGGQNGGSVTYLTGGLHGSFFVTPIDLTGITALDIQIGTAGNLTYIREAATPPHTGAVVAVSKPHGSPGGSAINGGMFGLAPTNSLPGNGGNGGTSGPGGASATAGQSSALAAGGFAGVNGPAGGNAGAGGAVSAGSQVKCGGAGGGGGGGANVIFNGGGWGGAGGYPGGAGGSCGQGYGGGLNGANGPGAPGVGWLVHK